MAENLPAVVEHRDAAAEAQGRGDEQVANEHYLAEQAALAGEAVETRTEERPSIEPLGLHAREMALAPLGQVDPDAAERALVALAEHDSEGTLDLRRSWGADAGENLAHAEWVSSTFLEGLIDMAPDVGVIRLGAVLGRGIRADIEAGNGIGAIESVSAEVDEAFWRAYADDGPDELAAATRLKNSMTATDRRVRLGAIRSVMRKYGVDPGDTPNDLPFWEQALKTAPRIVAALGGRTGATTTTRQENTMSEAAALSEDAYEDQLAEMRAKTEEAQARGDSRRANALYVKQQEFIAARQGS